MELRAQLGQAEVTKQQLVAQNQKLATEKQELELVNEELRNDVEVAENDRIGIVLKDQADLGPGRSHPAEDGH